MTVPDVQVTVKACGPLVWQACQISPPEAETVDCPNGGIHMVVFTLFHHPQNFVHFDSIWTRKMTVTEVKDKTFIQNFIYKKFYSF